MTHYDFVGRCNRCFKFSERSVNFTERLVVRSLKDPAPGPSRPSHCVCDVMRSLLASCLLVMVLFRRLCPFRACVLSRVEIFDVGYGGAVGKERVGGGL